MVPEAVTIQLDQLNKFGYHSTSSEYGEFHQCVSLLEELDSFFDYTMVTASTSTYIDSLDGDNFYLSDKTVNYDFHTYDDFAMNITPNISDIAYNAVSMGFVDLEYNPPIRASP